jgi:hypothetical protein
MMEAWPGVHILPFCLEQDCRLSPYFTATIKIRGNRSSTLPSFCGG